MSDIPQVPQEETPVAQVPANDYELCSGRLAGAMRSNHAYALIKDMSAIRGTLPAGMDSENSSIMPILRADNPFRLEGQPGERVDVQWNVDHWEVIRVARCAPTDSFQFAKYQVETTPADATDSPLRKAYLDYLAHQQDRIYLYQQSRLLS